MVARDVWAMNKFIYANHPADVLVWLVQLIHGMTKSCVSLNIR